MSSKQDIWGCTGAVLAAIIAAFALLIVNGYISWPFGRTTGQVTPQPPYGSIHSVWVEHNVYENNVYGMRIHIKLGVENLANVPCVAAAYFSFATGSILKDTNGRYVSVDGQVSAGTNFTPPAEVYVDPNLVIFMPYDELELGKGQYNLMFQVKLFDEATGSALASSKNQYFTYTRN